MEKLAFIILRHIKDDRINRMWKECHRCIRKHYSTQPIVIIDDHSAPEYATLLPDDDPNTTLYQSPHPAGRGELIPYLYLKQNTPAQRVIILHDSVFLQKPLDVASIPPTQRFCPLWYFDASHSAVGPQHIAQCAKVLSIIGINPMITDNMFSIQAPLPVIQGCFGAMAVVDPYLVQERFTKHVCHGLVNFCTNRKKRETFERIISVILRTESKNITRYSLFGHICEMTHAFYLTFDQYQNYPKEMTGASYFAAIKVWTGR